MMNEFVPPNDVDDDTNSNSNIQKRHSAKKMSKAAAAAAAAAAASTKGHQPAILRRFALLVDGMARAMILSFGPSLVYRLVYGEAATAAYTVSVDQGVSSRSVQWPGVAYYLSLVVAVYILGRWLGTVLSSRCRLFSCCPTNQKFPICVARLGGMSLSLHVFTYGAGLTSVSWLIVIRFLSATVAGLLCGVTRSIPLPEDPTITSRGDNYNTADIASGTAKIYLTGFSVSILSGGLLFQMASMDSIFQALTGAYQYSWSPLFLVAVAVGVEVILRAAFAAARKLDDEPTITTNNNEEQTPLVAVMNDFSDRSSLRSDSHHHRQVHHELAGLQEEGVYNDGCTFSDGDPLRVRRASSCDFLSPARSRRESHTSASAEDFFDCRSFLSEQEFDDCSFGSNTPRSERDRRIARYVNNRCVYDDGSPAYVPHGNCAAEIPASYLRFYNGNQDRALQAWEATKQWRYEKHVWKIHTLPNPWFRKIKQAYPHFVHGHSKLGFPIIYEQPGQMNLKELFRNGCHVDDMVGHYTVFMEFISNCICSRADIRSKHQGPDAEPHSASSWGFMVVMDVKGAGLSHLSGDVLMYLKRAGDINSNHYPLSMQRAFLVNSPFWLAGAWSGIKGILPASVQVDILSESKYPAALRQYIDEDQIPPEYGGTSPYNLGEHPYEVELNQLVEKADCYEDDDENDSSDASGIPLIISTPSASDASDDFDVDFVSSFPHTMPMTVDSANHHSNAPPVIPIRRRVSSVDHWQKQESGTGFSTSRQHNASGSDLDVMFVVSVMYSIFSAVQGAIELAIPLWILSPADTGGLGYSPSRSGVSMFCASLVLLWTMRKKPSHLVSQIPSTAPMRAFRIGVGAESVLLAALTYISAKTPVAERSDSILVMTSTIIIFSCMALASMLGRSACKILHRIAAENVARRPNHSNTTFLSGSDTGSLTTSLINPVSEVAGIFIVAPFLSWSLSSDRPAPFDGTFILFIASLLNFVLYVCSFSLNLNGAAGEFTPHSSESCSYVSRRRCLPFLWEVISVSAGDMASLFEESNWSSTKLLGRSRKRDFSDSLEMMERGEGSVASCHKAK